MELLKKYCTLTDFSDVQHHGLTKKDWNDKHVYFMQDQDAQGLPVFIESVMGLIR